LGVLLFQALAGRFPYEVIGSMRAVVDNIVRAEPPPPSTLRDGIDDDVDTIVLKCLHKDRDRRYQSAGALAEDIEHYLSGRPIQAKRDSTWYVMRKTVKRHRRIALLGGAFTALTLLYALTMTNLYHRSRQLAEESTRAAQRADREAQELQAVLEAVVNTASMQLGRIAGAHEVRKELNQLAFAQLARLVDEQEETPSVRATLARSHSLIADFAESNGDYAAARPHTIMARELHEQLSREQPSDYERQADLSIAIVRQGDIAGPLGLAVEKLDCYHRALRIDERLVELAPDNLRFLDNLAWSYDRLAAIEHAHGRYAEAVQLHDQMHAIGERLVQAEPGNAIRLWALFMAKCHRINEARRVADWAAAIVEIDGAVPLGRRIIELEPLNPHLFERVSANMTAFSWVYALHGDPDRALPVLQQAEAIVEQLLALGELKPAAIAEASTVYACRAELAARLGDTESQRRAIDKGVELLAGANARMPGDSHILAKLAEFTALKARLAVDTSGPTLVGSACAGCGSPCTRGPR
jgi:tetratricopeptide (TPR) repeat protein